MAFTEAQQDIIDEVLNSSMKDDFAEDRETISKNFDSSITDEQKDIEKFKLAEEYRKLREEEEAEEADALASTASATTRVETDNLQTSLQQHKEVLDGNASYTVYEVLQQYNSPFLTQIQTQLTAAKSKESVEDFCDNIEKVWISYIKWSLKVELPEENLKSMATGLSFYFMDWLKRSGADAGKIADNADGLTKWDWSTKITKMLGTFGQIAGFGEVMGKVNRAVELINTHDTSIMIKNDIQDQPGQEALVLNDKCEHIFNTPHGFYDWIKGSLALNLTNMNYQSLSFEQVFVDYKTRSNAQTMVNVANNLDYTAWVHKLMDKVIHEGNNVLELRNDAKGHVKEIFGTIQWFISQMWPLQEIFGDIGGVSDMLDSVGLKWVADFVCLLLGFGTVEGLEQEYREEICNFSKEEKHAIGMCVSYAQKYIGDYQPKTHDDPSSFLNEWWLKVSIDQYNNDFPDNKVNLTALPTSTAHIIESFKKGFETVLPDPSVLINIPWFEQGYVETTTDATGNQILSITTDTTKRGELIKKLQDPDIIHHFIQYSMVQYSKPTFLAKFSALEEWKQPKTPSAFIGLLFSSCISPVNADKAREFDVLDHTKLGVLAVGPLLGLGAAAADKAAKEKQAADRKALVDAVKDATARVENAGIALENAKKTTDTEAMNKATKELQDAEKALEDAKHALEEAQKNDPQVDDKNDDFWSNDESEDVDPADALVAWAGVVAWVAVSREMNKESLKPSEQKLSFQADYDAAYIRRIQTDSTAPDIDYLDDDNILKFIFAYEAQLHIPAGTLAAFMCIESNGRIYKNGRIIQSSAKAKWLMQFIDPTAVTYANKINEKKYFWIDDATQNKIQSNAIYAILASGIYIQEYMGRYNVNWEEMSYKDAVVAYNAGPWRVGDKTIPTETKKYIEKFELIMSAIYDWSSAWMYDKRVKKILSLQSKIDTESVAEKAPEQTEKLLKKDIGIRWDSVAVWLKGKWYGVEAPATNEWKNSKRLLDNCPSELAPTTLLFGGRNDLNPWGDETLATMKDLVEKVAMSGSQPVLCLMPIPPIRKEWSAKYTSRKLYRDTMLALDGTAIADTWKKRKIIDCKDLKAGRDNLHPASYDELDTIIKNWLNITG